MQQKVGHVALWKKSKPKQDASVNGTDGIRWELGMGAPKEWGDEAKLGGGDTIRDFDFTNPQFISCNYRSLRQPAKHVVSPPTPFLPHDNHPNNHPNMRTYAISSQLPCDSTKQQSRSHFEGAFRNYFDSFLNNSWPHYPSKLISGFRFGTFWYVISDGWR